MRKKEVKRKRPHCRQREPPGKGMDTWVSMEVMETQWQSHISQHRESRRKWNKMRLDGLAETGWPKALPVMIMSFDF